MLTKTATLTELLAQIAAHDRAAFAALYTATNLKLFGIVLRILRRRAVAEDILQDVYIKIWERAGDFSATRGAPITWMAAIARNRALDEIRSEKHFVSAEDMPGFEDIPSAQTDALAQIQQNEQYQKLSHCLGGIDDEKRQMILLAYYQGYSRDTLAKRFSQPVATIKTWLRRGLQSLKQCLES